MEADLLILEHDWNRHLTLDPQSHPPEDDFERTSIDLLEKAKPESVVYPKEGRHDPEAQLLLDDFRGICAHSRPSRHSVVPA